MAFAKFMSSMIGRWIRIVAGVILIAVGLFVVQGAGGTILAVVGLAPLLAGIFNFCLLAPLFGVPFMGKDVKG
jgi:hypothetical protein